MNQDDQGIMTFFETEAHSFVMRFWRENGDEPSGQGDWRGWIEHVQSAQRHYIRSVSELPAIVSAYIGDKGDVSDQVFMPIRPRSDSK